MVYKLIQGNITTSITIRKCFINVLLNNLWSEAVKIILFSQEGPRFQVATG